VNTLRATKPENDVQKSQPAKHAQSQRERTRRERILMLATLAVIAVAWIIGYFLNGTEAAPLVPDVIPGSVFIQSQGNIFIGYNADRSEIMGYAAVGEADGYGGPIEILVGVSPDGAITGVQVVEQRESPGFFRLIERNEMLGQYLGLQLENPLQLGEDIDTITGATVSAEGIAVGIREAARAIADEGFGNSLPPEQTTIQFGIPEISVLSLFVTAYFAHKMRNPTWKLRIRWVTLLTGLVVIGFLYTIPLTITMVIALLSGYWPDWHNNLYWYFLIGGILFVTTVDTKNPYCNWFCPFGAFQECLAAVTHAKSYRPRRLSSPLKWLQRSLALIAIVLGLILRKPGVATYEPFATLFDLRGTGIEWVFLILILLVSLVLFRPFCAYLCPLEPVVELIAAVRRSARESWMRWRKSTAKP
jgi:NosR/NirI family transcriptional regulator, nitrous oxide reductase regulator